MGKPYGNLLAMTSLAAASMLAHPGVAGALELTALEELGKNIFYDRSLATPGNKQGCISCHEPEKGWVFPDAKINRTIVVAPGAKPHRLGDTKPPSNGYASKIPVFQKAFGFPPGLPGFAGGNFWNRRAQGCGSGKVAESQCGPNAGDLGVVSDTVTPNDLPASKRAAYAIFLGPTADQALNPFQRGVEQNAGEKKTCQKVKTAKYKKLYDQAYGEPIDCRKGGVKTSFKRLAVALAAWQSSADVDSFSSKRDRAIRAAGPRPTFPLAGLTAQENRGHDLFYGKAGCNACHNGLPGRVGGNDPNGVQVQQLYTDSRYHNIGVPFNRQIPGVPKGRKTGLAEHVRNPALVADGFNKTPTIRNVAKGQGRNKDEKAYFHNGWAKSLKTVVHFYNTRDVKIRCETLGIVDATEKEALANDCWPRPEFEDFVASPPAVNIGALGLTDPEEDAVVAYMEALSDQHTPTPP